MTRDEVNGRLVKLQEARQNEHVIYWLKILEELGKDLVVQSYNEKGEEAVRALGVQKGIGMCLMLDKIYERNARADAAAQIIKPR